MPVRGLIEAARLLGIAENSIRVALARLLAAGRIERDERGQYRLGDAEPRRTQSGRIVALDRATAVDVEWIVDREGSLPDAHYAPSARTRQLHERALRFLGFRGSTAVWRCVRTICAATSIRCAPTSATSGSSPRPWCVS